MNKLDVRASVIECTKCKLSETCNSPVPFAGKIPSKLAVLGEAPGRQEDAEGLPFVGPSGQLLRQSMCNAGLDPEGFAFINTVSCFPTTDSKGRAPLQTEVEACASNRENQILASDAEWIILTGNVPLHAYRPDLKIGRLRGQPLTKVAIKKTVLFPIYHPAAVLRNRTWMSEFENDLRTFKEMVDRADWVWIPVRCAMCSVSEDEMERAFYDEWAVTYCQDCWPKRSMLFR